MSGSSRRKLTVGHPTLYRWYRSSHLIWSDWSACRLSPHRDWTGRFAAEPPCCSTRAGPPRGRCRMNRVRPLLGRLSDRKRYCPDCSGSPESAHCQWRNCRPHNEAPSPQDPYDIVLDLRMQIGNDGMHVVRETVIDDKPLSPLSDSGWDRDSDCPADRDRRDFPGIPPKIRSLNCWWENRPSIQR